MAERKQSQETARKTVDVNVYALAEFWLKTEGWTCTSDVMKLAQALQSYCEDFTADLENEYEEACTHDRH